MVALMIGTPIRASLSGENVLNVQETPWRALRSERGCIAATWMWSYDRGDDQACGILDLQRHVPQGMVCGSWRQFDSRALLSHAEVMHVSMSPMEFHRTPCANQRRKQRTTVSILKHDRLEKVLFVASLHVRVVQPERHERRSVQGRARRAQAREHAAYQPGLVVRRTRPRVATQDVQRSAIPGDSAGLTRHCVLRDVDAPFMLCTAPAKIYMGCSTGPNPNPNPNPNLNPDPHLRLAGILSLFLNS